MDEERCDYRLGFKGSKKSSWDYTYWFGNCEIGEIPEGLKSLIDNLTRYFHTKELCLKLEKRRLTGEERT